MNDRTREQEELRAAQMRLAATLVEALGPVLVKAGSRLADWWADRREAKRLEQERKELLLLQEETNRRRFTELVAEGRIEEARQRFPDVALLVDPDFDSSKYELLEERSTKLLGK